MQKRLLFASGAGAGASGTSALVLYARNRRRKFKRQPGLAQKVEAVSAVTPPQRPPSFSVKLPVDIPCDRQVAPPRLEISVRGSEGIVVVIATNFASKNSRKVLRKKLKEIHPVTWEEQAAQEEPPSKLLKLTGTFPVSLSEQDFEEEVALKLLALGAHYNGKDSMDWFVVAL
ncbi:MAG: hypothetical protein SFV17_10195 [Candidatus Obscuribacter sp.]|nr:hypothetical protein [Candidatus Obscuribacter sp.]